MIAKVLNFMSRSLDVGDWNDCRFGLRVQILAIWSLLLVFAGLWTAFFLKYPLALLALVPFLIFSLIALYDVKDTNS